jgi:transglutaminase/protease-like cytokinesis protein 3
MMRELEQNRVAFDAKIEQVLSEMQEGDERFKLQQISDYLADAVEYEYGTADASTALFEGKGNCNAFATAFKYMAERLSIPCDICFGYPQGGYHSWNRVLLKDGSYLYYDVTFYQKGKSRVFIEAEESPHVVTAFNDYYAEKN